MTSLPTDSSSLSSDPAIEDIDLLTIRQVLDPNGISIIGTATFETSFRVIGNGAEPNKVVWIVNGANKLGEATSNGSGEWQTPLIKVTDFNCYAISAVGKYGTEPVSIPPRRFTVATEKPIIDEVRGEKNPIPDNGSTHEKSVTIHATSLPNQEAEAFDGDTLLKSGSANSCGKLSIVLLDLEAKTYTIKIKSSAGEESSIFTFTVKVATSLSIDEVTDDKGNPVAEGASTSNRTLTVEGSALADGNLTLTGGRPTPVALTADADGNWQYTFIRLIDGVYSLNVEASYNDDTAGPRTFTVRPVLTATLDTVTDKNGNVVEKEGVTSESEFDVEGQGEEGQSIEIFDGAHSLGEAQVTGGRYTHSIGPLVDKSYVLVARAKYPDGGVSAPYPFTVKVAPPLTIDQVTDEEGNPVAEGASTTSRTLTVEGDALAGGTLSLTGGRPTPVAVTVDEEGKWSHTFTALPDADYSLNVEASYNDDTAGPRTFTVRPVLTATLETVTDKNGKLVEKEDVTSESEFDVEGLGEEGQSIEIVDGAHSLGEAQVTGGRYKHSIGPLADKSYVLVARAKYPDGGESAPYPFTVEQNQAPRNTKVYDFNGTEIADNGTTTSRNLTVRGDAHPLSSVKIKINGEIDPDPEEADENGKWVHLVSSLQAGTTYAFSAVAADNHDAESNTWTIRVVAQSGNPDKG